MTSTTCNKDIEDIVDSIYKKDKDYEKIEKNYGVYLGIIFELNEWLNKQQDEHLLKNEFNTHLGVLIRRYKVFCKKSFLIYVLRKELYKNTINIHPKLWQFLQKKSRNISGITNITLLTSPFPDGQKFSCKHNCYYCPNEPAHEDNNWQAQPRSYLYKEPAVMRANAHKFEAYEQMIDRMNALLMMGMEIDKLEIIIEGGTYTEYPTEYLKRFHRDIFYAANTFFEKEKRPKMDIYREMYVNITTKVKIIGICIETRPDVISSDWIRFFRYTGTTRIQLGIQHLDNEILDKINRGHTIEQAIETIDILKDNGFKIDIHIMPDLPGSNPEKDKKMFYELFNSPNIQADQVKIYPCSTVPWTIIEKWYKNGTYKPYAEENGDKLVEVVKYAMSITPPWVRLPRVIRDIPVEYIQGGCKQPSMRQDINNDFIKEHFTSNDIRVREIGRNPEYQNKKPKLCIRKYMGGTGVEYFISYESIDNKALYGFLRLRITNNDEKKIFKCLKNKSLVRELHVYGNVTPVGGEIKDAQHKGLGKKLLNIAEHISIINGKEGISVISGIGVMGYYTKLGYKIKETYMVKYLCGGVCNRYMSSLVVLLHSDSMLYKMVIKVEKVCKYLVRGYIKLMKMCEIINKN